MEQEKLEEVVQVEEPKEIYTKGDVEKIISEMKKELFASLYSKEHTPAKVEEPKEEPKKDNLILDF